MNPIQNVKGNLRKQIQFWREIGTSKFILKVIEEGYKLPFKTIPVAAVLKINNSAKCHQQFVQEAIAELVVLIERGIQSQTTPHVVNPLSVSIQANGKKRLILDVRYVNKCLDTKRVKYEDWKVALSYFEKDAYMFSFDLKSDYHHIEIHEDYQTFLGFAWKDKLRIHGSAFRSVNCTIYIYKSLEASGKALEAQPHQYRRRLVDRKRPF